MCTCFVPPPPQTHAINPIFAIKTASYLKEKREVLSCQDCFLIRDNKPQDSNCECSNNGSIYTNLLRDIIMKPTHSNNMNCC